MEPYRNFIDGKWTPSKASRTVPNVNPANTGDVIGQVPMSSVEECRAAIASAERALPAWRATPAPQRGRIIDKARIILQRRKQEIAEALTREEGKLVHESLGEVQKASNVLEFMSGEAIRLSGETLPSELGHTFCYTIRQPIGVVAAITPWNFPVCIPAWKIAPALATGCTVVFKPATLTPHTAMQLVQVFEEAGVPAGALNLIYGSGGEIGNELVRHPAVRAVSFTGSNEVGMGLYRLGAEQGKKIQCEMGGKNPVVVLEDADFDLAVEGVAQGAFSSTGQRCTATSRVVIIDTVADAFVAKLVERSRKIRPGSEMGPSVDASQLDTVMTAVQKAREEGAKCILGGERERSGPLEKGFFFPPTIFDHVKPTMNLAQEEVFGPVLAILRVKSFEEAMEVANGVRYGLTSSIYANDPGRIFRFVEGIETGITHVNSPTMGGEPQLPFGGVKQTGLGSREMGRTAIDFYSELKTVYVDYTGQKRATNIY
ncbi:MAG: aldehyde dehydrogenase family protein [Planctomycetes bacterium]|nr:aldehyde dehydrogenase family protein [Planctomycetota bacterium]